eukprot:Skav212775  [mRNA]  locus=scaffold159:156654:163338:- [translate_table: standard]
MGFEDQVKDAWKNVEGWALILQGGDPAMVVEGPAPSHKNTETAAGVFKPEFAFSVFAFLVGFGIQAAVGSAWVLEEKRSGKGNEVTQKVMLITAFVGAAGAWRWGRALLECKAPDLQPELMQCLSSRVGSFLWEEVI